MSEKILKILIVVMTVNIVVTLISLGVKIAERFAS